MINQDSDEEFCTDQKSPISLPKVSVEHFTGEKDKLDVPDNRSANRSGLNGSIISKHEKRCESSLSKLSGLLGAQEKVVKKSES